MAGDDPPVAPPSKARCVATLAFAAAKAHISANASAARSASMQIPDNMFAALKRGFAERCPNCGKGKLFRAYLKPVDQCAVCGTELGRIRADDGPAYFTILLIGHFVVAPLLFFPFIWQLSPWVIVPLTEIPLLAITLWLLPRVKGAFIGYMFCHGMQGEEHGPSSELHASDV